VKRRKNDGWIWLQITLLAVLVTAASLALWYWHEPIWEFFGNRQRLQEWVKGFGPWAPLVSIALNAAQVLLAPIPGQIVGLANGYLYGVWLGTLYSMIGLVLGRAMAMALGRWFGRGLVELLVKREQLEKWDRLAHRRGPLFFFLVFLLPFLPDDLACFLVGLSPLPIPRMVVLSALGGLPGVLVSCWVGASASAWPWWAWIPLVGGAIALAWAFWRYEARLEAAMVGLIGKLTTTPSRVDEGQRAEDD
jgi:uncharacterized membrane protein YdjX (TVP38/TMEM64 family)